MIFSNYFLGPCSIKTLQIRMCPLVVTQGVTRFQIRKYSITLTMYICELTVRGKFVKPLCCAAVNRIVYFEIAPGRLFVQSAIVHEVLSRIETAQFKLQLARDLRSAYMIHRARSTTFQCVIIFIVNAEIYYRPKVKWHCVNLTVSF